MRALYVMYVQPRYIYIYVYLEIKIVFFLPEDEYKRFDRSFDSFETTIELTKFEMMEKFRFDNIFLLANIKI